MKICRPLLIVFFLLAVVAQVKPAQQQPITRAPVCPCSVEIVVQRLFSDVSIPDAQISLLRWMSVDSPGSDINANTRIQFTNNDGTAIFRYLEQGRYTVIVKRDGFTARSGETEASYTFNIPEPPGFRSPAEGTSVDRRIMFSLVVTGSIVGTLRNAKGEPAASITIAAFRNTYSRGQRVLNGIKATETGNNGEYRLGPLPDGEYYLRTDQPYSPVYYPGTLDPAQALPVILRDGHQVASSDFKLPEKGGVTISGIVTVYNPSGNALPDGRDLRSVSLYLIRRDGLRDEYPQAISDAVERSQNKNGGQEFKIEVHNVAPGTYDLFPVFVDTSSSSHPIYLTERNSIEVGPDDNPNIKAAVHSPGEVTGRFRMVDSDPVTATRNRLPIGSLPVQFESADPLPKQLVGDRPIAAVLAADGTFRIADLIPGKYVFTLQTVLPRDLYVAEMRQGTRDFSDDGTIVIQSGSSEPIDIVVRTGGGEIHGSVQKPNSNFGSLVLIPDLPRRQNRLYYRSVRIPPTGRFDLTGIAPGTYKLFAWDSLPDGAERDPKFIEQFETRGIRVTVAAGLVLSDVSVPLILNTN